MRALLDTHAFLWFATGDSSLSAKAKSLIVDPANDILISPASYWEVSIKVGAGKYPLSVPFERFFTDVIDTYTFAILPIKIVHAAALATLPLHHKDPFDRLIIAQALVEGIPVVSADSAFDAYSVTRFW